MKNQWMARLEESGCEISRRDGYWEIQIPGMDGRLLPENLDLGPEWKKWTWLRAHIQIGDGDTPLQWRPIYFTGLQSALHVLAFGTTALGKIDWTLVAFAQVLVVSL